MQSMNDQPSQQSVNHQQSTNNQPGQEIGAEQTSEIVQNSQVEGAADKPAENQMSPYRGMSEQIPFAYTPTPGPYQPGQEVPAQPVVPPPTQQPARPMWNYPPRPEHYQGGAFGQPGMNTPGSFGPATPGQPGQSSWSATGPAAETGMSAIPPVRPRRSGLRTGAIIALVLLLAVVFGTGLFAGWQFGRTSGASSPANNGAFQPGKSSTVTVPQLNGNNMDTVREAVVNKVQPGVVQLLVTSAAQQALGSGVIIDGRGYIITNGHVVAGAVAIQVTLSDGTVLPAHLVGTDPADDLAVIKITPPSSGLTVVTLGDSSQLRVGQAVLAIGSPLGNTDTVTSGIVSALNRNVSEGQNQATLPDAIQTDAPINPGNSGGALVDMQGNLIGIPTLNAINTEFNTPANGLGFAIPSNRVKFIAQQLITTGHVTHTGRAILGVEVTSVDQNVATQNHLSVNSGVLIVSVTAGSPATAAGLKANDVIVQFGSATIHNNADLSKALLQHNPGETVAVKIYRGSQQLTVNVTLGEMPANS